PAARPAAAPPPPPPARPPVPASGSLKDRLLAHLAAEDMKAYVDAVEHAEFTENASEIRLSAPKEFGLALKSADIRDAVQKLLGRAVKINFIAASGAASGDASGASAAPANAPPAEPSPGDDPLTQEALGHPEVQRFQQTFPGSHVRTVRNLRD
ncbi:MAG: hypothetical protein J0L64_22945, partial [Acidobacteria bacterium]|nr:hypothetical protein [Acidobacteriota bacterium]